MLSVSNILLPVDFSESSAAAARYARRFAERFNAAVTLLHVAQPVDSALGLEGSAAVVEFLENRCQVLRSQVENLCQSEFGHLRCTPIVIEGDPASTIVHYAHNHQIDLVIMPTHGRGLFRRFLLGSTTAKALDELRCPVFTGVHLDNVTAPDEIVFRTVAAAVDLGPQTRAVIRWAHDFASACGAELHLLHAVPSVSDDAWRNRIAAIAREDLAAYTTADGEIRQSIEVVSGQFPSAVCTAVEAVGADLLVIGRGHGTAGGRIRSHVLSIVRESPCPVVSV